jgi:microcystin-dependent protein
MSQLNLPLQMPTLPEGFCNTLGADWPQQLLNAVAQGVAILQSPGNGYIIINQESAPDPTQRTGFLWRKPSLGSLLFQWIGAAWVCPHIIPPGSQDRRLFEGDATALETYDGGSAGAVGDSSGPMWMIDPNWSGRSPMCPGPIPDTTDTLVVGTNYGEGKHVLIQAEIPAGLNLTAVLSNFTTNLETDTPQWLAPAHPGASVNTPPTDTASFSFINTGGGQAHQTVHPVRGVNVIVRTKRVNYVAS